MESWQLRDFCYVHEVGCRHERKFLVSCLEHEYTSSIINAPLQAENQSYRLAGEG